MIRKRYPGGKSKAFNISCDDGVLQDIPLIELLNHFDIKGTFNLNYGLLRSGFTWQHESGRTIRRIPEDQLKQVYEGHEIASHSYSHPYFDQASEMEILKELGSDKFFLEACTGREVAGYATPFYFYSDLMADCVRSCGFAYARISEESNDYSIPEDFYRWKGSKFLWDPDLEEFVQKYLESECQDLSLCQLVGHSYDLEVLDLWDTMRRICWRVSIHQDVWCATHLEIVRYLRNMRLARITDREIYNGSDEALWFDVFGTCVIVEPGETFTVI